MRSTRCRPLLKNLQNEKGKIIQRNSKPQSSSLFRRQRCRLFNVAKRQGFYTHRTQRGIRVCVLRMWNHISNIQERRNQKGKRNHILIDMESTREQFIRIAMAILKDEYRFRPQRLAVASKMYNRWRERNKMMIDIRSDKSLYVTIGRYTYYIDDSTNEQIINKFKTNRDEKE